MRASCGGGTPQLRELDPVVVSYRHRKPHNIRRSAGYFPHSWAPCSGRVSNPQDLAAAPGPGESGGRTTLGQTPHGAGNYACLLAPSLYTHPPFTRGVSAPLANDAPKDR